MRAKLLSDHCCQGKICWKGLLQLDGELLHLVVTVCSLKSVLTELKRVTTDQTEHEHETLSLPCDNRPGFTKLTMKQSRTITNTLCWRTGGWGRRGRRCANRWHYCKNRWRLHARMQQRNRCCRDETLYYIYRIIDFFFTNCAFTTFKHLQMFEFSHLNAVSFFPFTL